MARARRSRRPAGGPGSSRAATLRIVGGAWRGRRIAIADRPGLRPTPDRVRETLFNWLAPRITGARCWDMFAGTGALGLEALSRGAAHVVFSETDRQAADALRQAITTLDAGERARLDTVSALTAVPPAQVELVFVDPPFDAGLHAPALALLAELPTPPARIYIEYPADQAEAIKTRLAAGYDISRQSQAGGVGFCLAAPRLSHED